MVSRYGGEEFAILLPGTNVQGARVIAEKIRARIESQTFSNNSVAMKVTVSIGIASCDEHHPPQPEDLLAFADKALYEAKGAGRNCIRIYSDGSDVAAPMATTLLTASA